MRCDNCRTNGEPAYELTANVIDGETRVDLSFCSVDCLQAWV